MNPADPKPDYSQMMKQELVELIDALEIEPLPKQFMKSRWLDQLMWMEGASKKNQRFYYLFRLCCIIGGVTIPALVSLNMGDRMGAFIKFITVVLSLIVAVSAAIEEFFHFGERWRHYRRVAEMLKGEGWSFFQLSGSYQSYKNHADAYPAFAGRVEESFQQEVEVFITKLSREKQGDEDSSASDNG